MPAQEHSGFNMPNPYFQFKQFTINHDRCVMKVTTDSCLFGSWCAEEIKKDNNKEEIKKILDIGTGSGLLSLMIAQKNDCFIDAIEMDEAAAQQAKQNIAASAWKDKISVHQINAIRHSYQQLYNAIISNPPFYENELESPDNKKNIAHHGEGLRLSQLMALIKKQLLSDGSFYLLLPYKRKIEIEKIIAKENLFIEKRILVSQSTGHTPFRLMIKGTSVPSVLKEKQIFIRDTQKQYSKEFIYYLKDYYLHL